MYNKFAILRLSIATVWSNPGYKISSRIIASTKSKWRRYKEKRFWHFSGPNKNTRGFFTICHIISAIEGGQTISFGCRSNNLNNRGPDNVQAYPLYRTTYSYSRRGTCKNYKPTEKRNFSLIAKKGVSLLPDGRESRACKRHCCFVSLISIACHFHSFPKLKKKKNFALFIHRKLDGLLLLLLCHDSFTLFCGFDAHYSNELFKKNLIQVLFPLNSEKSHLLLALLNLLINNLTFMTTTTKTTKRKREINIYVRESFSVIAGLA